VRDDVTNASELAAAQCEAAVDDVTSHVTMTSRRLSDVAGRALNVSTMVEKQLNSSSLVAMATVNKPAYLMRKSESLSLTDWAVRHVSHTIVDARGLHGLACRTTGPR